MKESASREPQTRLKAVAPKRKLSVVFHMPDISDEGLLSTDEIEFFKTYGFLVKKKLLSESKVARVLERTWEYLLDQIPLSDDAPSIPSPCDPRSWIRPRWQKMPPADKTGFYEGRQRNVYSGSTVKLHDLGSADFILDLLPNNDVVRSIAETFLGSPIRESTRTRGVYAIFPMGIDEKSISGDMLGPHSDRVCQQFNACAYLDNVPPRGGGFTVYPGSHKIMFNAHECESNWSPLPNFQDYVRRVVQEIEPYELVGEAGDVIFWHGRMIHTAGIHSNWNIRWALFADFCQERPSLTDDEHRAVGQYEWFKDTRLYRSDKVPSTDMWRSWNI